MARDAHDGAAIVDLPVGRAAEVLAEQTAETLNVKPDRLGLVIDSCADDHFGMIQSAANAGIAGDADQMRQRTADTG